jgi:hypothetical protein
MRLALLGFAAFGERAFCVKILFKGETLMAASVRCAKGHWYHPDPSGKPNVCPRCLADSRRVEAAPISDDEVMDFLNESTPKPEAEESDDAVKPHKCAIKRHKKICPACHGETSFAFEYCPRCGGPLIVAVIEV